MTDEQKIAELKNALQRCVDLLMDLGCERFDATIRAVEVLEESRGDEIQSFTDELLEVANAFVQWAEKPSEDACGMAREQKWLDNARAVIARTKGGKA